jgi:hypothetical protein
VKPIQHRQAQPKSPSCRPFCSLLVGRWGRQQQLRLLHADRHPVQQNGSGSASVPCDDTAAHGRRYLYAGFNLPNRSPEPPALGFGKQVGKSRLPLKTDQIQIPN